MPCGVTPVKRACGVHHHPVRDHRDRDLLDVLGGDEVQTVEQRERLRRLHERQGRARARPRETPAAVRLACTRSTTYRFSSALMRISPRATPQRHHVVDGETGPDLIDGMPALLVGEEMATSSSGAT